MEAEWLRKFLRECEFEIGKLKLCRGRPKSPYWTFDPLYVKVETFAVRGKDRLKLAVDWNTVAENLHAPSFSAHYRTPFADVPYDLWQDVSSVRTGKNEWNQEVRGIRPEMAEQLAELDRKLLVVLKGTEQRAKAIHVKAVTGSGKNPKFVLALQKLIFEETRVRLDAATLKVVLRVNPYVLRDVASFVIRQRSNVEMMSDDDVEEAVRLAEVSRVMKS